MYHETGYFTTRLTIPKLGVFGNFKNLYPFHWLRPLTQIFHHLKDHQGVVDGYQLFLLHLTRAFCFGHDMSWPQRNPGCHQFFSDLTMMQGAPSYDRAWSPRSMRQPPSASDHSCRCDWGGGFEPKCLEIWGKSWWTMNKRGLNGVPKFHTNNFCSPSRKFEIRFLA
jgi:hypothetical protein